MTLDQLDTRAGQAVYSPGTLRFYDWFVLGLSCRLAWRCPADVLLAQYETHVGARHLDVGVGSGYFLDRCRFPVARPQIVLLDLNDASLAFAANRIARLSPRTWRADILEPLTVTESFDSIGLGFLLHCLPGDMAHKARAIANLAPLLSPDGVLFGSTILAAGVHHNAFGRALVSVYNRKGIFSNLNDSATTLRAALDQSFADVSMSTRGTVALFTARRRRPSASS